MPAFPTVTRWCWSTTASASGPQLWALAQQVMLGVREKFGVQLEPEPVVIGAG